MAYIIIWAPNSREEEFSTFEEAKESAEANLDNEHFRNYAIFEEVTS